jgi:hypothetical protein
MMIGVFQLHDFCEWGVAAEGFDLGAARGL